MGIKKGTFNLNLRYIKRDILHYRHNGSNYPRWSGQPVSPARTDDTIGIGHPIPLRHLSGLLTPVPDIPPSPPLALLPDLPVVPHRRCVPPTLLGSKIWPN